MDNLQLLSERLTLISEYNYYLPEKIAEDEDESLADLEGESSDDQTFEEKPEVEDTQDDNTSEDNVEISDDGTEVEIDVTDIVGQQEKINQSIEDLTNNISNILNNVEQTVSGIKTDMVNNINTVNSKISDVKDELTNQMKKRNPTPEEQLELRSMQSYPYNLKLTDYWKPTYEKKEGLVNSNEKPNSKYDVKIGNGVESPEKEEDEFVLKAGDVFNYNDSQVKNSF